MFGLPDSAVYVALAVENEEASRVDSRGGKRWEVLVHDDSGRIAWNAYEQKVNDLFGRSSEAALATARERAEAYPDDPRAWSLVRTMEQINLSGAAEAFVPAYRERVLAMHRRFASMPSLSNAQVEAMRTSFIQLDTRGDTVLRRASTFWKEERTRRIVQQLTGVRSDVVSTDLTAAEWIAWELNKQSTSLRLDSVRPRSSGSRHLLPGCRV